MRFLPIGLTWLLPLAFLSQLVLGGKWMLHFQTANTWMAGYIGDVTVCLHFEAPNATNISNATETNSSVALPSPTEKPFVKVDCQDLTGRSFKRGKPYTFAVDFTEDISLEKARIFAKQAENVVCKNKSGDTWHIDEVSFHSLATGILFAAIAPNKPMYVRSMCGAQDDELLLSAFSTSVKRRPCIFGSAIYKDSESFMEGCSRYCECSDAKIMCLSMCPPMGVPPNCRLIYYPGKCCKRGICEDEPVTCPAYQPSDCEASDRTVDPGEYPWAAFIKLCNKEGCNRFCSGALLNARWLLTAAECFFWGTDQQPVKPEQMRVILGKHTLILDEDRDMEIAVTNITMLLGGSKGKMANFGLIKLKEQVFFDRTVQPVVLPISKEQCMQLVLPGCGLSLSGWVHVGKPENEQYELFKLSTQVEKRSSCIGPVLTNPSRRQGPLPPLQAGQENMCLNMDNDAHIFQPECNYCQVDANSTDTCFADKTTFLWTGERGRALVSNVQVQRWEVNYLVGITSYKLRIDESPKGLCKVKAFELAINLCHDLHMIKSMINVYFLD